MSFTDRANMKNCGAIKTLMREAVHNISPEAIKEKGIQQHTEITEVAYRFRKIFTSAASG